MTMSKKFILLTSFSFILFCQLIVLPVESKNEDVQHKFSVGIDSNNSPVKYNTNVNQLKNQLDIFASFIDSNNIYLSNFMNDGSGYVIQNFTFYSLANFGDYNQISDFNYYHANNTCFITITNGNVGNALFHIIIKNENTTQFFFPGYFQVALINQLSDSSDVYFSIYNSTTFLLLKYSFETQTISTVFHTENLPIDSQILFVDVYTLDDKIYLLIFSKDTFTNSNLNSWVYILNNNSTVVFSKAFVGLEISSFTSYDKGLILYSMTNSSFFKFEYAENKTSFLSQSYHSNISSIRPFDNATFLTTNDEFIGYYKIGDINETLPNIHVDYFHYITPTLSTASRTIQAIKLDNFYYYLLASFNQESRFVFQVDLYNVFPTAFKLTTAIDINNNNYIYTTTQVNSSAYSVLIGLMFIIFLLFGVVAFYSKFLRSNPSYYLSRDRHYLGENASIYQKNNNAMDHRGKMFCSDCGSSVMIGDMFCQYCGNKL
jgi:hypothetical protein